MIAQASPEKAAPARGRFSRVAAAREVISHPAKMF
jgi:hypothetical protein